MPKMDNIKQMHIDRTLESKEVHVDKRETATELGVNDQIKN